MATFAPRLLKAINHPPMLLPTHWDNWEKPITDPPQDLRDVLGDGGNLHIIVKDIKQESPISRVVVPKCFESFAP